MAKLIVAIMAIMFVIACGQKELHHDSNGLPPGYKLVCSEDGKHFTFIDDDGWTFIYVFDTKEEAMRRAISYYKFEHPEQQPLERDQYTWHVCETN